MVVPPYFWNYAPLTESFTPKLLDEETITQIIEDVGIYQGEWKVLNRQNGRLYLTTKRIFYVDNDDTINNSVFFNLIDIKVDHIKNMELYSPSMVFLKSSPKITLVFYPESKFLDNHSTGSLKNFNKDKQNEFDLVTWRCKICLHKNVILSKEYDFNIMINNNLNEMIEFPSCANCGMKCNKNSIITVLKKHLRTNLEKSNSIKQTNDADNTSTGSVTGNQCKACTFSNHELMQNCELCGSALDTKGNINNTDHDFQCPAVNKKSLPSKSVDRGFIILHSENDKESILCEYIKLSFHSGSLSLIKKFLVNLKQNLLQLSLLKIDNNVEQNKNVEQIILPKKPDRSSVTKSGIAALESKQHSIISQNESILESSLEDLTSLMDKAKQLQRLVSSFDKVLKKENQDKDTNNQSKYLQTLSDSRDILGINSNEAFKRIILSNNFNFLNKIHDKDIFYRELARNISSFLSTYVFQLGENKDKLITDSYPRGIIQLIDLYALYNRSLGFNNNLISPSDLLESVKLFKTLKLPLKFRIFVKSGLMVIQDAKSNDEEILNEVIDLLIARKFKELLNEAEFSKSPDLPYSENHEAEVTGRSTGINIQKLVEHFNLNINILNEILYIGLEKGLLLIDEDISGSNYYLNEMSDFALS